MIIKQYQVQDLKLRCDISYLSLSGLYIYCKILKMEVDEEISDPEKKTEGRRYSSFISFRNGDFHKNFVFTAAFLYRSTVFQTYIASHIIDSIHLQNYSASFYMYK